MGMTHRLVFCLVGAVAVVAGSGCAGVHQKAGGPGTAGIGGTFTVPSNLTPGVYNVYVDADNATALHGNGPVDASNYPASPNGTTNPSIALGTDEAVTQVTLVDPSTTVTTPANSSIVLGNSNTDSATDAAAGTAGAGSN